MAYFTWKEAGLTADCASLEAMAARFEEAAALMRRMAAEGFVLERHSDGQHITHGDASVFAAYGFIDDMVLAQIGEEGRRFFPFVFTLFMFILFGNMLGLFPYAFTYTSHITMTFMMALIVFILIALIGKGIYDAVIDAKRDEKSSKRRFFGNANHVDTDVDADDDRTLANRISMRTITETIRQRESREAV